MNPPGVFFFGMNRSLAGSSSFPPSGNSPNSKDSTTRSGAITLSGFFSLPMRGAAAMVVAAVKARSGARYLFMD